MIASNDTQGRIAARPWTLAGTIRAFRQLNVLVLGDAMLDRYACGSTRRLCPDAPAPVVDMTHQVDLPGGAGNAAANAARLGANTRLLSVIGDDATGHSLTETLQERQVNTSLLIRADRATLLKQRIVSGGQTLVRCDSGNSCAIAPPLEDLLLEQLERTLPDADLLLISDYGYGVLTPRVVAGLRQLRLQHPNLRVAVDARCLSQYADLRVDVVKPNLREAAQLLQLPWTNEAELLPQIVESQEKLLRLCGSRLAAVTLDSQGALILERQAPPFRHPAQRIPHAQVSGAGDTYLATFALALTSSASPSQAADVAAVAASIAVEKPYTATCSAGELLRRLDPSSCIASDLDQLAATLDKCRAEGRRIVLTCGCFDILHRGHVTYLARARELGDLLVVAVNSDESVTRLKGPSRPVNALNDRLCVLSALGCVNHLVAFSEDRPDRVIEMLRPDIFVKGGDYSRETLAEADLVESLGGRVVILPLVEDRSTSRLIERIHAHTPLPTLPAPLAVTSTATNG